MQYELINPSDPYTFMADNLEIAALTVFSLSTMYGASSENGDEEVPVFLFGGEEEWYQENFHRTILEGMEKNRVLVGQALLSFMLGSFSDRRKYEAALRAITEDSLKQEFIEQWQDERTSINNIGTYARQLGKELLECSFEK